MPRPPKKWTMEEDNALRAEVEAQPTDGEVKNWCQIASRLPGRTNKDCRKRWHNAMAGGFKKGQWSESEDKKLLQAVEDNGQRWTVVAKIVESRSADQCAKRWQQSLNPMLDRSKWTEQEDQILMSATKRIGRQWKQIQQLHFPERSKNGIKNRYTTLSRRPPAHHTPDGLSSTGEAGLNTPNGREWIGDEDSDGDDSDDDDFEDEWHGLEGDEEGPGDVPPLPNPYDGNSADDSLPKLDSVGHLSFEMPPSALQAEVVGCLGDYDPATFHSAYENPACTFENHGHPCASPAELSNGDNLLSTIWPSDVLSGYDQADTSDQNANPGSGFDGQGFTVPDSDGNSTQSSAYSYNSMPQIHGAISGVYPHLLQDDALAPEISQQDQVRVNPVTVTLSLQNPDSDTMQSLMRFAMENEAKFRVERQ